MIKILNKFKKREKGFTLIEIIVVIALISIIGVGSIVGINYASKKNEDKKIEKAYKKFDDALEVYLSNHPEIYTNLEENVEGAVITLEVLKNEGLVAEGALDQDNKPIDYKDSYYVLSDAVLLQDPVEEETTIDCKGQVGLSVLKSWGKLSEKVNTEDIIYICPKSDENVVSNNSKNGVDELEKRISALEKLQGNEKNIFSGNNNVNNYVYFNVDSITGKDKAAYFPTTEKNLWRIHSYYGTNGSNNNIKLIYSQKVNINSEYITLETEIGSSDDKYYEMINGVQTYVAKGNNITFINNCKSGGNTIVKYNNNYYKYKGCIGKCKYDKMLIEKINSVIDKTYLPNTFSCDKENEFVYNYSQFNISLNSSNNYDNYTIKKDLYNSIKFQDWIEKFPYYTGYHGNNPMDAKLDYSYVKYDKLGVINIDEYNSTISGGDTWLKYYNDSFIGSLGYRFDSYMVYPSNTGIIETIEIDEATAEFIPVITLKAGVEIITDDSCGTPGTKSCPYILKYGHETTSNS